MLAGAVGYVGLVVTSAAPAFSGSAPLDLRLPVGLVLLASASALCISYAVALHGPLRVSTFGQR